MKKVNFPEERFSNEKLKTLSFKVNLSEFDRTIISLGRQKVHVACCFRGILLEFIQQLPTKNVKMTVRMQKNEHFVFH